MALPASIPRLAMGASLALLGAAAICSPIVISNCDAAACQRAMFSLGLAGSAAIAAIGQIIMIYGLWLIWLATRR